MADLSEGERRISKDKSKEVEGWKEEEDEEKNLPLNVLLAICAFLVADGDYKDLDNFRKTCRSFASAVNEFMVKGIDRLPFEAIGIIFKNNVIAVSFLMRKCYYCMHPLSCSKDGGLWKTIIPLPSTGSRFISGVESIWDRDMIDDMSELLRGSVKRVFVVIAGEESFDVTLSLLRNLSITNLHIKIGIEVDTKYFNVTTVVNNQMKRVRGSMSRNLMSSSSILRISLAHPEATVSIKDFLPLHSGPFDDIFMAATSIDASKLDKKLKRYVTSRASESSESCDSS